MRSRWPLPTIGPSRSLLLALALLLGSALGASCNGSEPRDHNGESSESQGNGSTVPLAEFSGTSAFELLEAQVAFGPRVPGSEAHQRCGDWLVEQLRRWCDSVTTQEFTHVSTYAFPGQSFPMRNIIGVVPSSEPAGRQVVLAAHWDSRPFADRDPVRANRTKPVPGANDGASGVAAALEIARCLSLDPSPNTVIVCLFDGEDFGLSSDYRFTEWLLGSKHFVANLGDLDPKRGILLDMVGDRTVQIGRETASYEADPVLVERIWRKAADLGRGNVFVDTTYSVIDDHIPLIEAGIPCVDLIDWRPEVTRTYWHTIHDTPDKCSPAALQAVGEVVLAVLRDGI